MRGTAPYVEKNCGTPRGILVLALYTYGFYIGQVTYKGVVLIQGVYFHTGSKCYKTTLVSVCCLLQTIAF